MYYSRDITFVYALHIFTMGLTDEISKIITKEQLLAT